MGGESSRREEREKKKYAETSSSALTSLRLAGLGPGERRTVGTRALSRCPHTCRCSSCKLHQEHETADKHEDKKRWSKRKDKRGADN